MTEKAVIVPHTHWDREWYLPFQRFRYNLVHLIDTLLEIMTPRESQSIQDALATQNYRFMLDGQTVVLEDYLEIRPEKQDELLRLIREGKVVVGPWYLLPDEWLVGGESIIRNLEYSNRLAQGFGIPLMQIAYLPDQFGHTSAIPQIVRNLTGFRAAVVWRGVPPEVKTTVFTWKSSKSSDGGLLTLYLPGGYGNVSRFPEEAGVFEEFVTNAVDALKPFSPLPVYLLMNGSDHLLPQPFVVDFARRLSRAGHEIQVGSLADYLDLMEKEIRSSAYTLPVYEGEFKSPARAPMLQGTYSARMWIKIWNQRIEDLILTSVEPICTYLWYYLGREYPMGFLDAAWKWLLQNQPHDSICGCSVDQTHEEMKTRFSWSQSIAEAVIDGATKAIEASASPSGDRSIMVFHAGPSSSRPIHFEFAAPDEQPVRSVVTESGHICWVQPAKSREEVFLETTMGVTGVKMALKLLPGRKIMDFYVNGVEYTDGAEPGLMELKILADRQPVGDFDIESLRKTAHDVFASKRYRKIHVVAAKPSRKAYACVAPLTPWSFTKLGLSSESPRDTSEFTVNENGVTNRFYRVTFNKDGSLTLVNKATGMQYGPLHVFEDYGDRGDEYTFGSVEPQYAKTSSVKRRIRNNGPVLADVEQTMTLELYESLDSSREKRAGKVQLPVESVFRFYSDSPRIEVVTKMKNRSRDHRLRICFDLPYTSEYTQTATHFGCIRRRGDAEVMPSEEQLSATLSTYPELPSGAQSQKRFIRVDQQDGTESITVFNRGLTEVELVNGRRIGMTLLRSVASLSREDFHERPMHAGPAEATPGAQELDTQYEFRYGIMIHSKNDPLHLSADESEAAFCSTTVVGCNAPRVLNQPLVRLSNPNIVISSLRVRGDSVLVTLYNLSEAKESAEIGVPSRIKRIQEELVDSSVRNEHRVESGLTLTFGPREIKMLALKE